MGDYIGRYRETKSDNWDFTEREIIEFPSHDIKTKDFLHLC